MASTELHPDVPEIIGFGSITKPRQEMGKLIPAGAAHLHEATVGAARPGGGDRAARALSAAITKQRAGGDVGGRLHCKRRPPSSRISSATPSGTMSRCAICKKRDGQFTRAKGFEYVLPARAGGGDRLRSCRYAAADAAQRKGGAGLGGDELIFSV